MPSKLHTGTLESNELMRLVHRLGVEHFSGLVRLAAPPVEIRLYFKDGEPRFCLGSGPHHSFAAYLVRAKMLSAESVKGWIERATAEGSRLEEFLVKAGKLSGAQLRTIQSAMSAFAFGDAACAGPWKFRCEPGGTPAVVERFTLKPARALCDFVLRFDGTDHVRELAQHRASRFVKDDHFDAVAVDAEAIFGDAFRELTPRLTTGFTPAELAGGSDLAPLSKLLHALLVLGGIRRESAQQKSPAAKSPAAKSPAAKSPAANAPAGPNLGPAVQRAGFTAPLGRLTGPPPPAAEVAGLLELLRSEGFSVTTTPSSPDVAEPTEVAQSTPEPVAPPDEALISVATSVPGGPGLASALAEAVAAAASAETRKRMRAPQVRTEVPHSGSALTTPPDAGRPPPQESRLRVLFDLRARLSRVDPFDALGVPPGASPSEIKDAYVSLRARYDRSTFEAGVLIESSLADLEAIETGFDQAVDQLLDPAVRGRLEAAADGGLSDIEVAAYFKAELSYKEGRRAYEKRDYPKAVRRFRRAVTQNGTEPLYHLWTAQTAWDAHIAEGSWTDQGRTEVERHLTDAIVLKPDFEGAKLLLARLYLERGEGRGAHRLYTQVLGANPRNSEAAAAVRELADYDVPPPDGITGKIGNVFAKLRRDK
ncbi:MAG: hypothetical protein ACI9OJ_002997 [Myxococcota bacterium]|jgi:hypothetical protein